MAQKVNSTNLRLNKRFNWNVLFCAHNFNDYSNLILNASKILTVNNNILYKLNNSQNNSTIVKNSKMFKINYDILDQRFFFFFTKVICAPKRAMQNYYNYQSEHFKQNQLLLKNFLLNNTQLVQRISNSEIQKKFRSINRLKRPFLFMFPKMITEFAKLQMSETKNIKLKKSMFSNNLQGNLLNFITGLLREFKYDILGLKIICSGKWKKTRTGRKQKLYLKFGQIQSSNIANKIMYHNIAQKTKYGVCSIKVWIAHKVK